MKIDTQILLEVINESFKTKNTETLECFIRALERCGIDLASVFPYVPTYEVCKVNQDHYCQIEQYKWYELKQAFAEFNELINKWWEHQSYLGGLPDSDLIYHKHELDAPQNEAPIMQLCIKGDVQQVYYLDNNFGFEHIDYLAVKDHADKRLASVQGLEVSE